MLVLYESRSVRGQMVACAASGERNSGNPHLPLGRADTGKSARVVAALKAHQSAGERAILLVPEQYTYEAERLLADALGGLLGVQVFS